MLWTAKEAAEATGGTNTADWAARGVSIDSRDIQPGDLFVALKDVRDGHEFVAKAFENGAAAALVTHRPEGVAKDAPLLIVDDVLRGLENLGRAARARVNGKVVGITGSVGKTSTKDMLRVALQGQGQVHAAHKSLNNHWGVPLTLARMPRETDFALIEIGMNHPGEITPLSRLARPDVTLITTVAAAHMAAFSNVDEIAHAKAEIFAGLAPGGVAILNADIATFEILRDAAKAAGAVIHTFGRSQDADFQLVTAQPALNATSVRALLAGEPVLFKLQSAGTHFALNALGVLASVIATGADPTLAALDLAHWTPPDGRGARALVQLDKTDEALTLDLIDDAYNANPASMAAALEVLAASRPVDGIGRVGKGRRIAFLTDMLELGPEEAAMHAAIAAYPAMSGVDLVHCAGPLMKSLHSALPADQQGEWHENATDLAARVRRLVDAGDVAMVKGSKGSKAALVVDAIKKLGQAKNS